MLKFSLVTFLLNRPTMNMKRSSSCMPNNGLLLIRTCVRSGNASTSSSTSVKSARRLCDMSTKAIDEKFSLAVVSGMFRSWTDAILFRDNFKRLSLGRDCIVDRAVKDVKKLPSRLSSTSVEMHGGLKI